MNTKEQEHLVLANQRLIIQVAEHYSSTKHDMESYRDMNFPVLEELSAKHLMHWKQRLHELIFNGMNCYNGRTE